MAKRKQHRASFKARALRTYRNTEWLRAKLKRGLTHAQIARDADVSISMIAILVARLGLQDPLRHHGVHLTDHAQATYANRAWFKAQLDRRVSYREIALKTGASIPTIYLWVHRHGLKKRARLYTNHAWMANHVAAELCNTEIAALADCSLPTITTWQRRLGITANPRKKSGPWFADEQKRFGEWLWPRIRDLPLERREILVIKRLNGIGGKVRTLKDVGSELGVTRERIRQIHQRALRKIVAAVGAEALKDFPKIAALPPYIEKKRGPLKGPRAHGVATYGNESWLRERVERDMRDGAIAREANARSRTICHWRHHFGIKVNRRGRPFTSLARETYANRDWLAARVAAGKTDRKIAGEANTSVSTINAWRRQFGFFLSRADRAKLLVGLSHSPT